MANVRWILLIFLSFSGFGLYGEIKTSSQESKIKLINARSQLILNDPLEGFTGALIASQSVAKPLQGSFIQCSRGRLELGALRGWLEGSLDPLKPGSIALTGGCSFAGDRGSLLSSVTVAGKNNRLAGWVNSMAAVTLSNASAALDVSIENRLGQDIVLNGGSLRLVSSLDLAQGVVVRGNGCVDADSHAVILRPGNTIFSDDLLWRSPANVFLCDTAKISGSWTVGDVNPVVMNVNGFGHELDLSLGGTIIVQSGCCLVLEDVILTGLGAAGGTIQLQDETSSVVFIGSTIRLAGDYAITAGRIVCSGRDSTLVTGSGVFTLGGTSCLMVAGVTLYYDVLGVPDAVGISILAPSNLAEDNDGRVLPIHRKQSDARLVIDDPVTVCSGRLDLTGHVPLSFRGSNATTVHLIGVDLSLTCVANGSSAGPALITVADGKQAVISDTIMSNFDPAYIYCGVGAGLVFGDNVELNLSHYISLSSTFTAVGSVIVRGEGNIIDCSKGGVISVASGADLTLQDVVLSGIGEGFGSIVLADASSCLRLKNVTLALANSYTQPAGIIKFTGSGSTITTGKHVFSVDSEARCIIDGVHVVYDPLDSPDIGNIRSLMSDGSNIAYLKGGSCAVVDVARVAGSLDLLDSSYKLQRNELLSEARKLRFAGSGCSCVVNGQGFSVSLPFGAKNVIEVAPGKRLECKDTVFKDFSTDHVLLHDESTLALGDGVVVLLYQDLIFSCNLTISGKAIIDCAGHRIIFRDGFGFVVESGGSLELRNGFLVDLCDGQKQITLVKDSSKLILNDMACSLVQDFTFSVGSLEIVGNTYVSSHRNSLLYTSAGPLRLQSASMLYFDNESIFRYDVKGGAKNLIFTDKASGIYLDGATFSVGTDGVDLATGTLWINGVSIVAGDSGPNAHGVHFDNASFDTNVLLKATIDLQGLVVCG